MVSAITFNRFVRGPGRFPVGRRTHDELVQRLHPPAVVHEPAGEPIQQFGMRRQFALAAKIIRRRDKAAAEVHFPNTVHHHAGGERIIAVNQPLRQAEAVARRAGREGREARRGVAFDQFPGRVVSAALQHKSRARDRHFPHRHDFGDVVDEIVFLHAEVV